MGRFQAQNALFRKLAEITDVSTLSSKERERYDESLKIYRDNYAADQYSYNKGRREGEKKGLEEGLQKGLQQGTALIAKNMKEGGMDIQIIIRYTGLTKEQIDQL